MVEKKHEGEAHFALPRKIVLKCVQRKLDIAGNCIIT